MVNLLRVTSFGSVPHVLVDKHLPVLAYFPYLKKNNRMLMS
jgi:hypothetical protein